MNSILEIRRTVLSNLDEFVKWPKEPLLLWNGCSRDGYHTYPNQILELLRERGIYRRGWSNDPAIHSFLLAGGDRLKRKHKGYGWNIHHLYFGVGVKKTLHAVKDGKHFTQSAGVVAVHPIADTLCEEDSDFTAVLRDESFKRFGYDPDGIFSSELHDEFGFISPHTTRIIYGRTSL